MRSTNTLWNTPPIVSTASESLPDRMWEMLHICPDLKELTIDLSPTCSRDFDLSPLTRCWWPRLRKLTIGTVRIPIDAGGPLGQPSVIPFLIAHDNLEALSFRHPLLRFSPSAPLHLRSFHGLQEQIDSILIPSSLQHLQLTSIGIRDFMLPNLIPRLSTLDSLVSLRIWLDFSLCLKEDRTRWFSPLLQSCLGVSHLELLFSWPTSPSMVSSRLQYD
jgi:hypothetical protein